MESNKQEQAAPTVCKACMARVKDWEGDDPKCGFVNGGQFSGDNWQCVTVGKIRGVAVQENDFRIAYTKEGDQQYATISTLEVDVLPSEDDEGYIMAQPVCLWVGWYKSRGRTEGLWLMFENHPPRRPTEEECLKILKHYGVGE